MCMYKLKLYVVLPANVDSKIYILLMSYFNLTKCNKLECQCAKKVVADSPKLVDFAIELLVVNFELNLPDEQVNFFEEFKLKNNCEINSAHQNIFEAS